MFGYKGFPFAMSKGQVDFLMSSADIELSTLARWDAEAPEWATAKLINLAQMLAGCTGVHKYESNQLGDHAGIDLVFMFEGKNLGVQIKSSEEGAEHHMERAFVLPGSKQLITPGVFWVERPTALTYEMLRALADFLGVEVRQEVEDAVTRYRMIRGTKLGKRGYLEDWVRPFTQDQLTWLVGLNMVAYRGGRYQLLK